MSGFRILFVCTGNICRSPMAERMTRHRLGGDPDFTVTSAGLRAVEGAQMSPSAARVLTEYGADTAGFAARPLTPELLADADLVLTADLGHRAQVAAMLPETAGRLFTMMEFGVFAAEVPDHKVTCHASRAARAAALVGEARGLRGLVRVPDPDIADPYQRSGRVYRATGRRIAAALDRPVDLITR